MDTLILEDFRCFAGRHEVPLRPLTLLVGENSTGKTSFLAAKRLAHEASHFGETPDFNEEPFNLGAFDDIAFRQNGGEAAASFKVGFRGPTDRPNRKQIEFEAMFDAWRGIPHLASWKAWIDKWSISVHSHVDEEKSSIEWKTPHSTPVSQAGFPAELLRMLYFNQPPVTITSLSEEDAAHFHAITRFVRNVGGPIAFAPIRAQPRRTYELTRVDAQPQGEHVPVVISRIFGTEKWETIGKPLCRFARSAGLFDRVSVKRLGKNDSGPFQIMIKVGGTPRNIMDVGYGVSQALPLAVDLIRGEAELQYMIQQPEVHLHPRAQAELGTLFGSLVKTQRKQFLIETHSDHLIDRVRMDVREKKNIGPDDVVILYFERRKNAVQIYPIFLDERANLLDVPPTYRQFFLQEQSRFMGVL